MQVTEAGGFYAEESWDGRDLFYSKTARSGTAESSYLAVSADEAAKR